ncbi:MAG: efflux RND transporter permease subunit [Planctomycetota bacterium]
MKGLVNWFIDNPVAANLLMVFIIAGGGLTLMDLKQEVFPDAAPDLITVTVVHPGATPEEIEEGICLKVEEEVEGLEGVKRVTSMAAENIGQVSLELLQGVDKDEVLDDVKTKVDSISTFPADAEKPVIVAIDMINTVMELLVAGETDPVTLHRISREIRDELAAKPGISLVTITNDVAKEISIEISEDALRRYGLTFDDVSAAVRGNSLNLAGGTVKTRDGEILLRANTQAYVGREFEDILLLRSHDGTRVRLGDVADVVDAFEDVDHSSTLDGKPSYTIAVARIGDQSTPAVARTVFDYVEERSRTLPGGITLTVGKDWSDLLRQRRELLLKNGKWGLVLIFAILTLFLRFRLAAWVAVGLLTALLGAIWMLPGTDVTVNMMSLFGFIVVLGILVDDAIVVGENIYYHSRRGLAGAEAAKKGAHEVMKPVVLAVLTTIAAFVPMLTLPGTMGKFARVIPIVVICSLTFSLVESLLILPRHLSHLKPPTGNRRGWGPFRYWVALASIFGKGMEWVAQRAYRPGLLVALRWRYLTLAVGVAMLILTVGVFSGGLIEFVFFPPIEGDQMIVSITMPEGTPARRTSAVLARVTDSLEVVRKKAEADAPGSVFRHVLATLGSQPQAADLLENLGKASNANASRAEVFVLLHPPEKRNGVTAEDLMRDLRAEVGEIPGVRDIKYDVAIHRTGLPISVQFRSDDLGALRAAADRMKGELEKFAGVFDTSDDMLPGKVEYRLFVKPGAEALGITQADLARQARQGFYGDEAQRIQRGRDDVKVMVRYPKAERRSLADLENMRIRRPGGGEVPFSSVARVEVGRSPAVIHRADGARTVNVSADVDLVVANPNEIIARLREKGGFLERLTGDFPGVTWRLEGEQREQAETLTGLRNGSVIAALLIFTLLALAFGSFVQPLIVLIAIPFGMVGAIIGHMLLGLDLTMLSSIGLLAMSGVVVNDSMILVDFVNRGRASGLSTWDAIVEAGPRRFRPIILTSLTTFAGLTPLLLETSVQAQFLIPMAVSLGFGVLFSTFVILGLVPVFYLILEDIGRGLGVRPREV